MLGVSGLMGGSSGDGAAETHESGGGSSEVGGSSSVAVEESGGGGGGGGGAGNRWPREETLALIRIRSEMDATFRDSSLKGPLWEEVSRKMASLGFQRSSKKCKEKFENVYKYHKRTKDGRAAKSDGKSYRFFEQLEALENSPAPPRSADPPPPPPPPPNLQMPSHVTVSSISPTPLSVIHPIPNPQLNSPQFQQSQPPQFIQHTIAAPNSQIPPQARIFRSESTTSSSSTSSDEDIQRRRGKKRKWKDYFERLMKEVVEKQEALQMKFLETLENREKDRAAREEAWRVQETARMNREHEILVRERSMAAAKDAALIAFLQKVSDQNNPQISPVTPAAPAPPPAPAPAPAKPPPPPPPQQPQQSNPPLTKLVEPSTTDNGGSGESVLPGSSSRWPKSEIQALIDLRTRLDLKYLDNAPKGPLWEEISAAMAKVGYNRSAKRCKEKWENINKYYKKVKESNKKRPEDSKTCPYFHQLEAIYKERAKHGIVPSMDPAYPNPPNMGPVLVRPEQQWPLPNDKQQQQQRKDSTFHDQNHNENESENNEHEEDEFDEEDEDEMDEDGGEYELLENKQPSTMG